MNGFSSTLDICHTWNDVMAPKKAYYLNGTHCGRVSLPATHHLTCFGLYKYLYLGGVCFLFFITCIYSLAMHKAFLVFHICNFRKGLVCAVKEVAREGAQFIVSNWGEKVDNDIGLSYRPVRLPRLAGRFHNPKNRK